MSFEAPPQRAPSRRATPALHWALLRWAALLRAPLGWGRRAAARMVERLWAFAFRLSRQFHGRTPRWSSTGSQRVLIVAPHPDDEAIGCAGTALLHTRAKDRVWVAIATDGRRSRVIEDPAAMARQRRLEAEDAARLMQVERLVWIGLPEGEWELNELRDALRASIADFAPDLIYAPSRIDFHPEHIKVANTLARALEAPPAFSCRVRVYQVQVPLTSLLINLAADVSCVAAKSDAVLQAYSSQSGSVRCAYRRKRYAARRHGIAAQAEEFWELAAAEYVRLHRAVRADARSGFRGLRYWPFTDPMAHLMGRGRRKRLALEQQEAGRAAAEQPGGAADGR